MKITRCESNPLVTPADVKPSRDDFEVLCAFNAGVARFGDETLMLIRTAERPIQEEGWVSVPALDVETGEIRAHRIAKDDPDADFADPRVVYHKHGFYLSSISHIRIARSTDGLHFSVDDEPAIGPQTCYETFGIEDPRVTHIDGKYYIDYASVSEHGVSTSLAVTEDFVSFERMGVMFCPSNRDVVIFPEKINGRYAAYHRPAPLDIGTLNMWLAWSPDLIHWGGHENVIGPRPGLWDSHRVGAGAPPLKTERGWLSIYHGATPDDWYHLGALLADLDEPGKIIARSEEALLSPEAEYELHGFYGHVVFTCGTTLDGDRLRIYYGAADTVMAAAEVSLSELLDDLAG